MKNVNKSVYSNGKTLDENEMPSPEFIDIFAGAGGLSLGLLQAGWRGLFAVEKSSMAFETLKFNLVDQDSEPKLDWPDWLPIEAVDVEYFFETYKTKLENLKGLPLLAGGPPCQGYSRAGRRDPNDVRNLLVDKYLEIVDFVKPQILLVENVSGFATDFRAFKRENGVNQLEIVLQNEQHNADRELQQQLREMGYEPFVRNALMAKNFGVPQLRPRYILIAIKNSFLSHDPSLNPFRILDNLRAKFLLDLGLPSENEVTLAEAISDLLMVHGQVPCSEDGMRRFQQGLYGSSQSSYQKLMRKRRDGTAIHAGEIADSHRFPKHHPSTIERFGRIIREFRPGKQLREKEIESLGLNKHRIAPLAGDEACHTLTSLPDDLVHYCEPRIPTVREYARIQSFPDWFEFKSSYTTGGERRRYEIPRYTQVANAVPPLLAEAIGKALLTVYQQLFTSSQLKVDCIKQIENSPKQVPLLGFTPNPIKEN